MKLSELVSRIEALGDAAKPIVGEIREHVSRIGDVDTKDLAGELAAKAELTAQVARLGEDVKGVEELRATVAEYRAKETEAAIGAAFEVAATEHGVNPAAIKTARKLIAPDALRLDGGRVVGLTKDLFDGLRAEHPLLFEQKAGAAAPTVPALPPAGTGAAAPPDLEIPGPIGMFLKAR